MRRIRANFHLILMLIIPSVLMAVWFRGGYLLGSAESALPFYNLEKYLEQTKWAWSDLALGNVTSIITASAPTYWFLLQIQKIGVPGFIIEAFFFWFLFVVSGFSVYFLTRELFPTLKKIHLLLAVFYYWFNPFFLVNIWHRFLYNYMVFFALLPLAMLLYLKGIKREDYRFAVGLGLVLGIFAYALTSIAFNILLWLVLGYTTLFYLFIARKNVKRLYIVIFFVLTFVSYFFINFWWITQIFSFVSSPAFGAVITNFFTQAGNISTLRALSQSLGNLSETTRLMQGIFFKNPDISWTEIFNSPLAVIAEFLAAGIIFWVIYRWRKFKSILYLGTLFIITLFLVKGSNSPFGELFRFAFAKISLLQVFRNPFEKFGFLLPLATAPLFAFGIEKVTKGRFLRRMKLVILASSFVFVILFWGFPFWTRLVLTLPTVGDKKIVSYEVEVPEYYSQASEWLKEQGSNFRFVALPLGSEGITYSWNKPYTGVELASTTLFDTPNISYNTTIPFYSRIVDGLEEQFIEDRNFTEIMNLLNAKYILLRSDIDWKVRDMRDPKTINSLLESRKEQFAKVATFQKLSVWENKRWTDLKVYATDELVESYPSPQIQDLTIVDYKSTPVLYTKGSDKTTANYLINPTYKFYLESPVTLGYEEKQSIFPHVRFLPSSPFYRLVLLKEKIELLVIPDDEEIASRKLALLGKRLSEARKESLKGNVNGAKVALKNYQNQLTSFKETLGRVSEPLPKMTQVRNQEKLYSVFSRHYVVLAELENVVPEDVVKTNELLQSVLTESGIVPKFDHVSTDGFPIKKRNTYQFNFLDEGEYELLLDSKDWGKYYEAKLGETLVFQIDDRAVKKVGRAGPGGLVSYGKENFDSGVHEIGWNTSNQKNLVDVSGEITLRVEHGAEEVRFKIENFDPFTEYEISLDYWTRMGRGIEVAFEENNDRIREGTVQPSFSKFLAPDNYFFDFRSFATIVVPGAGADTADLVLRVKPWNDCVSIYWRSGKERCEDENFRRPYDRITEVLIKNVSVKRLMTEQPILAWIKKDEDKVSLPEITYKKIDPTEYIVTIKDASQPYYLVFSELFNSGWQANFEDGTSVSEDSHFLANAYANGWLVDKSGDYDIRLKFAPQEVFNKGKRVSTLSFLAGLLFLGINTWRKRKH